MTHRGNAPAFPWRFRRPRSSAPRACARRGGHWSIRARSSGHEPLDDRVWFLGGRGIVEPHQRLAVNPLLKNRKITPDVRDIEGAPVEICAGRAVDLPAPASGSSRNPRLATAPRGRGPHRRTGAAASHQYSSRFRGISRKFAFTVDGGSADGAFTTPGTAPGASGDTAPGIERPPTVAANRLPAMRSNAASPVH